MKKIFKQINENVFQLASEQNNDLEIEDSDYLSDPNKVSDHIRQIYGNQPSIQDIVEYFSSEYGRQAKSRLVKLIMNEFMMHNPSFYIILPRKT